MEIGTIQESFRIDPNSPTPFYVQLAEFLRGQVRGGDLKPGDKLLSEEEFCNLLGISRTTVRQSIRLLEEDGLLMRFRGRGTFINKPSFQHSYNHIYNFSENMAAQGLRPSSRVLTQAVVRAGDTGAMVPLELEDPDARVFRLVRARCVNGAPVIIDDCCVPYALCEGIERLDFEALSLYEVLTDRFQLVLSHAKDTLEAVVIGREDREILGCPENTAAFRNHRTAWLDSGTPYEYTRSIMRADRCCFQFQLSNAPNVSHSANIAVRDRIEA